MTAAAAAASSAAAAAATAAASSAGLAALPPGSPPPGSPGTARTLLAASGTTFDFNPDDGGVGGGDEEDEDEEDDELESISPQLTALRCEGRPPTLAELVAFGYLEALRGGGGAASGGATTTRQVFAVEVMFDEIRTGVVHERLPDVRAAAPHGDRSCSAFAITDDAPVDARVKQTQHSLGYK